MSPQRPDFAIAFDVPTLAEALALNAKLGTGEEFAKLGLELFVAEGPAVVREFKARGRRVFLDLKLHDIPTTVEKAAKVLGSLGASYLTLHAHGGVPMLRAGVTGLAEGAANAGLEPPMALAVTVLTSDADAPPHIVPKRVMVAAEAGCGGIVCAASDLKDVHEYAPRLHRVVPGIRPAGVDANDQARTATPREALEAGADVLVIGRPVTLAPDPVAAAAALVADLS